MHHKLSSIRVALAGAAVGAALVGQAAFAAGNVEYRIQPGDTLSDIAARYGTDSRALAAANHITNPNLIDVGDTLVLPVAADDAARPAASGAFIRPLAGYISTPFHELGRLWRQGFHTGVDLAAPIGTPIHASADGVVEEAGPDTVHGYGNYVKIDHGNSLETLYGHMSVIEVRPGQRVSAGDEIGRVGMTGVTTGPHVHWEARINGEYTDPLALER